MLSKKRKAELDEFLNTINLSIDNYDLLDNALTHSSYTFENKLPSIENNERLEFLGDAVLKLVASDYLHERFMDYSEGELTKIRAILISDNALASIAREINLGKYIKLGYHEEKSGGRNRQSTLACAFEALLGAFYLDGKINNLSIVLRDLLQDKVTEIDQSASKHNYKAILQEYAQSQGLELPEYLVIRENGPPHNKIFDIEVYLDGRLCGFGSGKSKKEAQQKAAEVAAKNLGVYGESLENE